MAGFTAAQKSRDDWKLFPCRMLIKAEVGATFLWGLSGGWEKV